MPFAIPLVLLNSKSNIMKTTKFIIATFFVASAFTTFAQDQSKDSEEEKSRDAKNELIFGMKAGVNRSNVFDEQGEDFVADPKTGFVGGAYLAIPIGRFLGLQPEVLFSQKGFSSTGRIGGDTYSLERTTSYLDVPLQLQVKLFRFMTLLGGVQYSYLLNQKDKLTFGTNSIEQSDDFENDNIRKNIFGAVAGVDFNIHHLVLSGKACWDLQANRGDGSSFTPRYKNVWLQATIGYRFY